MEVPFTEKYRPRTLDEVVGNRDIVARLRHFASSGMLPNILLSSPPGLGKTTVVLAIARQMLGTGMRDAFLELNASDERNLSDIREKVRTFVQKQVTLPNGAQKIAFLDEVDMMTETAQAALRRLMEDYSSTTRFCLACNNLSKVIEPIQSRCCLLQLSPVPAPDVEARLRLVCEKEGVACDPDALTEIARLSEGDIRQALNSLQAVSCSCPGRMVTKQVVYDVLDVVDPRDIADIMAAAQVGKLRDALRLLDALFGTGYSSEDVLAGMYRYSLDPETQWSDVQRARILRSLAATHATVTATISSQIQTAAFIAEVVRASGAK